MAPIYSPLRYPGGKGKLARFVQRLVEQNDLVGGCYVEPFAGGGGVALGLLFERFVERIWINDLDPAVYRFWWAVLNETDRFCQRVMDVPLDMKVWREQWDVLRSKDPDPFDLGFAAFFLNRTNRSGIIRGGPIGGLDQTSRWGIDARFSREALVRRLERVGGHRSRIIITNLDAVELLPEVESRLGSRTLVYLDPPYFSKGRRLYRDHMSGTAHEDVAAAVRELSVPWVVSYDNCPEIRELYSAYRQIQFSLQYSANRQHRGRELLVTGPSIVQPSLPLTA